MSAQTGHLWAVIQEWMDAMPYPPSQGRLADRLGISRSSMTDYKFARSMPSPDFLHALAAEIGAPYERVLDAALKDAGYRAEEPPSGRRPAAG